MNDGTGYDETEEKSSVETESLEGVIFDKRGQASQWEGDIWVSFKEMSGYTTLVFDEKHSQKRAQKFK